MADEHAKQPEEPRGFGQHTRGLAGEYAHEQGWGLDEEERTFGSAEGEQATGGTDYRYGAQDFGDTPVDTSSARPTQQDVDAVFEDTKQETK